MQIGTNMGTQFGVSEDGKEFLSSRGKGFSHVVLGSLRLVFSLYKRSGVPGHG